MLSFKKYKGSKPIAIVKGGSNNNKIIYITDEVPTINKDDIKNDILSKIMDKYNIDKDDFNCFNDFENELFDFADSEEKIKDPKTEIIINDGVLHPWFDVEEDQTVVYHITGARGSGKSTMCRNLIECYNKIFPKNKVVIFSKKVNDKAFYNLKNVFRVPIDEELLSNPIDISELDNTMCVFDDINKISDRDLQKYLHHLRDMLIEDGRSRDIYVISCNHILMDGRQHIMPLQECNMLIAFKKGGCINHLQRFAMQYMGLSKKIFNNLIDSKSRYICFYKDCPQYIILQNKCFIP